MKTNHEIQIEAQRLEEVGRRHWEEWRSRNSAQEAPAIVRSNMGSRVLHRFESVVVAVDRAGRSEIEPTETFRIARTIDVEFGRDRPQFVLVEAEYDADPVEGGDLLSGPIPVVRGDSVLDVLGEGYQRVEEDQLGELLAPCTDRIGKVEFIDSIDPALIEQIENIVSAGDLAPAERLRARGDIAQFLEGRLEPSDFITAAIQRQRDRETERETIAERQGERLLINQP